MKIANVISYSLLQQLPHTQVPSLTDILGLPLNHPDPFALISAFPVLLPAAILLHFFINLSITFLYPPPPPTSSSRLLPPSWFLSPSILISPSLSLSSSTSYCLSPSPSTPFPHSPSILPLLFSPSPTTLAFRCFLSFSLFPSF